MEISKEQAEKIQKRLEEGAEALEADAKTVRDAVEKFAEGADSEEAMASLEDIKDRAECGESIFEDVATILEGDSFDEDEESEDEEEDEDDSDEE